MSKKFSLNFSQQLIKVVKPEISNLVTISVSDPDNQEIRTIRIWQAEIDVLIDQLNLIPPISKGE